MSKKPTSVKVPAPIFSAVAAFIEACDAASDFYNLAMTHEDEMTDAQKATLAGLSETARAHHARVCAAIVVRRQMQVRFDATAQTNRTVAEQVRVVREKHGFSKLDSAQASVVEYALSCVEDAILAGRDPNAETEAWDELRDALVGIAKTRAACADELHPLLAEQKAAIRDEEAALVEVGNAAVALNDAQTKMLKQTEYFSLVAVQRAAKEKLDSFQLTSASQRQIIDAAREKRLTCV